jgi:hypothetical protein
MTDYFVDNHDRALSTAAQRTRRLPVTASWMARRRYGDAAKTGAA